MKLSVAALLAAPLVFFSVGCNPECVDKYDCASKITKDKADWTCSAGKCVEGDPGGHQCTPENQDTQCEAGQICEDFTCVTPATGGGAGGGTGGGTGGGATGGGGGDDGGTGGGGGDDGGTGGGGGSDAGVDPLVNTYYATLTGSQQVPAVTTTENGTATVDVTALSDGGYSADVSIMHSIPQGQLDSAHIHNAIAGRNGSPIVTLGTTGAALASPFSGTFDLTPSQAQEMKDGRTYVNIHTMSQSGGEIRGQLLEQGKKVAWAILNLPDGGDGSNSGWQVIHDDPMDGGGPEVGSTIAYEGTWGVTAASARTVENLTDGGVSTYIDMTANLTGGGTGVAGTLTLTTATPMNASVLVEEADGGLLLQGQIISY